MKELGEYERYKLARQRLNQIADNEYLADASTISSNDPKRTGVDPTAAYGLRDMVEQVRGVSGVKEFEGLYARDQWQIDNPNNPYYKIARKRATRGGKVKPGDIFINEAPGEERPYAPHRQVKHNQRNTVRHEARHHALTKIDQAGYAPIAMGRLRRLINPEEFLMRMFDLEHGEPGEEAKTKKIARQILKASGIPTNEYERFFQAGKANVKYLNDVSLTLSEQENR